MPSPLPLPRSKRARPRLGVALVEEGIELRTAGVDAPILVLSEPVAEAAPSVVAYGLTPVVYTLHGIDALAKAVADRGARDRLGVHLKVDTGMHRVGCQVDDAVELAEQVVDRPELELAGVLTHLAVADEPDNPYTAEQLARFGDVLPALSRARSADRSRARVQHRRRDRLAGRRVSTWCASASAVTASLRPTRSRAGCRCSRRCR